MAQDTPEENAVRTFAEGGKLRLFLIVLLVVAVILEGYYIHLLQKRIEDRNDELTNISVRLQFLKSEGEALKSELTSAKKTTGVPDSGNTPER
ncbi:MAG: hypothetical protein OEW04_04235 [Nitrospirota bacterium]|nr:hypothetical protein [Nitrospirota bacterium]